MSNPGKWNYTPTEPMPDMNPYQDVRAETLQVPSDRAWAYGAGEAAAYGNTNPYAADSFPDAIDTMLRQRNHSR